MPCHSPCLWPCCAPRCPPPLPSRSSPSAAPPCPTPLGRPTLWPWQGSPPAQQWPTMPQCTLWPCQWCCCPQCCPCWQTCWWRWPPAPSSLPGALAAQPACRRWCWRAVQQAQCVGGWGCCPTAATLWPHCLGPWLRCMLPLGVPLCQWRRAGPLPSQWCWLLLQQRPPAAWCWWQSQPTPFSPSLPSLSTPAWPLEA